MTGVDVEGTFVLLNLARVQSQAQTLLRGREKDNVARGRRGVAADSRPLLVEEETPFGATWWAVVLSDTCVDDRSALERR